MDLSIVIVNYNVRYFLEQCLMSVFQSGRRLQMDVFVVDNNSVHGSTEMLREKFPMVQLIANKENLGFSKANNQAIRLASGRHILLLNPDTVLEDNTLKASLDFMDAHPEAGALGVKMIDGRGRFLPESKRGLPTPWVAFYKVFGLSSLFPRSRVFGRYHLGYLDQDQVHPVDVLCGAFMMIRKQALEKAGLLDEDFFMYGEDIDLSYRLSKAGYTNYYLPHTRIIHYKGESTKKSSINYVLVFYNAMIIFARKHFTRKNATMLSALIKMAIYFRASLSILRRLFVRMAWPLSDALIVLGGFLLIKDYWEQHILEAGSTYYPPVFMQLVVPLYILIWLSAVYLVGGYDKPARLLKILRGVFAGTLAILVIYALLPESLRFSRALILLGAAWAITGMGFSRAIWQLLKSGSLLYREDDKRILIAGSKDEATRIAQLIRQSGNPAFIGLVGNDPDESKTEGFIGTLPQISEIIDIYRISEVIFCAGSVSSGDIINHMYKLSSRGVSFKIAPPEGLFIIGSNSIDTFGDIFMIGVNAIGKPANKRIKRLLDLSVSFMLMLTLPLHLPFMHHTWGFVKNLFRVLTGRRTWVGFHPVQDHELPGVKQGVLFPGDAFPDKNLPLSSLSTLNNLYAKDYRPLNDLLIIIKGYRYLGR